VNPPPSVRCRRYRFAARAPSGLSARRQQSCGSEAGLQAEDGRDVEPICS
jgi:hypothetical protein